MPSRTLSTLREFSFAALRNTSEYYIFPIVTQAVRSPD